MMIPPSLIPAVAKIFESIVKPSPANPGGSVSPIADEPPPQPKRNTLIDGVLQTVFGNADSQLSEEDLQARQRRRAAASQLANSAMNDPGESFMSASPVGGQGKSFHKLAEVITGIFK